jgi:preprotein translocase subunit SecG
MLQTLLLILHLALSASIIGLVLLQRGKGADAGAGFGSGASGTVFGARGSSTFFSKSTAVLATLFFMTSLGLAYIASHRTSVSAPKSVLDTAPLSAPAPSSPPAATSTAPANGADLPPAPASAPTSPPAPKN